MSTPTPDVADRSASPTPTATVRGRRLISLGMIAAGILYTGASLSLDRGELAQPGPGLYPLLVGALAILAGLGGLAELARGQVGSATDDTGAAGSRPWLFVAAMVLGVVLLPTMGYAVAATVCGTAVSWTAGQRSWPKALLTGLVIAVVTSVLFVRVLDVYLPASAIDRLLG